MIPKNNRIEREKKTVEIMIRLYCKKKHNSKNDLCTECRELLNYANTRLDNCKFGENKPTCGKCTVHCYKKEMQYKIKNVMRYAGPRILFIHPIIVIQHYIDMFTKQV